MASKKDGNGAGAPQNVDAYLRMNFLLQAATLQNQQQNLNLSRFYAGLVRGIAEKSVLRLSSDVKETICKFCNSYLTPGGYLSIRTKRKGKTVVVLKCSKCSTVIKRVPIKRVRKPRTTDTVVTSWTMPAELDEGSETTET